MKKFEYKVVPIATSIAIGTKGYEKAASEFENHVVNSLPYSMLIVNLVKRCLNSRLSGVSVSTFGL